MKKAVVYLKKGARLFIAALIRVTQTDPERKRERKHREKRTAAAD